MSHLRVALVHDYLLTMRGAERTFARIASYWPQAPIYTLLYDSAATGHEFEGRSIHTSGLQRIPLRRGSFRALLPLLPRAVERLPTRDFDLVVSSSSAFAHGVHVGPGAEHVCYCHNPFRYAWHDAALGLTEVRRPLRPALRKVLHDIREWDIEASGRVSHYIANSKLAQERIAEFYGREAPVVHPPVDVNRFISNGSGEVDDYFLIVAQLVRHKRIDVALSAARSAGERVKVVGSGPDLTRLRATYGSTAEFLGRVSGSELGRLYSRAKALVVPGIEEFGIAAVESQAAGRPVLAAEGGGARETVVPDQTGVLVPAEDVAAFAEAMRTVDFSSFDSARMQAWARQFSLDSFEAKFLEEVSHLTGLDGPRLRPSPFEGAST